MLGIDSPDALSLPFFNFNHPNMELSNHFEYYPKSNQDNQGQLNDIFTNLTTIYSRALPKIILTEEEIWAGVHKGDYSALKELYNRFFKALYAYGLKMTGNQMATEDAIHDLFMDVWKYRETLSQTTSIRFYLYRSLRRKIYKNDEATAKVLSFDPALMAEDLYESTEEQRIIIGEHTQEATERLKEKMKELPERQQESIALKFFGELSYKEIAKIMNVNEQSARNLIQRGLDHLRRHMMVIAILVSALFKG